MGGHMAGMGRHVRKASLYCLKQQILQQARGIKKVLMALREVMAVQPDAVNGGLFRGNVQVLKYADSVGKGAQSDWHNSQNPESQYLVLVFGGSGKVRAILVLSGLCIRSVYAGTYPIWVLQDKGRGHSHCRPFAAQAQEAELEDSMVRPRERMPSRRGPGRGESSRPPTADVHHHCYCCYCYRRAGVTQIPAGQFMEVGSSVEGKPILPAFGSVTFTLGSSRDTAGVNAHISVLFTKIPEEDEDSSSLVLAEDNSAKEKGKRPMGESSNAASHSEGELPHPPAQLQQPEMSSTAQNPMAMWDRVPDGQCWSRIVEEEPEE